LVVISLHFFLILIFSSLSPWKFGGIIYILLRIVLLTFL
jgi:hypothetical protein